MKIIQWIKILNFEAFERKSRHQYALTINDNKIENVVVHVNSLSGETYRLLRKFSTPRYDAIYLMRNKRGFNTTYFKQNYDVVVCDKNFRVIKTFINLPSGTISEYIEHAYFIYFACVGTINHFDIKMHDRMRIARNWIEL